VSEVQRGELVYQTTPVWSFDQLHDAHRGMDANEAGGKMVVTVP